VRLVRTSAPYRRSDRCREGSPEAAQREVMRLYAYTGQHSAALRQYQECVRLLDAELGAAPEPETTALAEAIKARRVAARPIPRRA